MIWLLHLAAPGRSSSRIAPWNHFLASQLPLGVASSPSYARKLANKISNVRIGILSIRDQNICSGIIMRKMHYPQFLFPSTFGSRRRPPRLPVYDFTQSRLSNLEYRISPSDLILFVPRKSTHYPRTDGAVRPVKRPGAKQSGPASRRSLHRCPPQMPVHCLLVYLFTFDLPTCLRVYISLCPLSWPHLLSFFFPLSFCPPSPALCRPSRGEELNWI